MALVNQFGESQREQLSITKIDLAPPTRIRQGDIYKDIDYLEYAVEYEGKIEVSRITFPYVIVMTQDCDLESDHMQRDDIAKTTDNDKTLISVILAPIYNYDHVIIGDHLSKLRLTMAKQGSKLKSFITKNQNKRYHYMEFDHGMGPYDKAVIDFKHYFSTNISYLESVMIENFVCKIDT